MESEKGLVAIIMAGGLGKRMNSELPKVLHKIGGVPMICHILNKLSHLNTVKATLPSVKSSVMIVVGKYRQIIEETINNFLREKDLLFLIEDIQYIDQIEPMGTGHAIQCCRSELLKYPNTNVLILSGDVPLISSPLMMKMVTNLNTIRIAVTCLEDSTGYGRIMEKDGKFDKIVEEKDCDTVQKTIQKVNCGLYAVDCNTLCRYLPYLKNNNSQNEYYLTDIIEIIKCQEHIDSVEMCEISKESQHEIMGVNTIHQLEELEKLL
jgi:bifunctional N-acetylglucosamine-1-phosphate-uridyltransferase/glucosamine-1-phosphate-acetyltransferase GlmU-like protein